MEAVETVLVVAGVIRKGDMLLIAQRKDDCKREPGKWEFPGGKAEAGETPQKALAREIMEELGVRIEAGKRVFCVSHAEGRGIRIRLQAYLADWRDGEPKALDVKDFRWVRIAELDGYDWARADLPIVRKLRSNAAPSSDKAPANQ
ncbi:(deoxy)nucleoside triphosphate pyrophosphohydrolase [Candidatus Micrarchaeota archaeon]|nr:(deoxy)nucleoside triphosphate pyrophosphohydrolase [Candidatus Micrarchaeota archaeon]